VLGQLPQLWEMVSELMGALHAVRLSGTVPVIAAAEDLVAVTSNLELNEKNSARFQRQADVVVAAQGAFLDACRETWRTPRSGGTRCAGTRNGASYGSRGPLTVPGWVLDARVRVRA
jgi:hypothetical protein